MRKATALCRTQTTWTPYIQALFFVIPMIAAACMMLAVFCF
jgi:hypothetical protein